MNVNRILLLDDASAKGDHDHPVASYRIAEVPGGLSDAGGPTLGAIGARQHEQAGLMLYAVDLAGPASAGAAVFGDKLFADVDREEFRCIYRLR